MMLGLLHRAVAKEGEGVVVGGLETQARVYRNTRELPVEVAIAGQDKVRLEPGEEIVIERAQKFSWMTVAVLIRAGDARFPSGYPDGNFRNHVFDGELWKRWDQTSSWSARPPRAAKTTGKRALSGGGTGTYATVRRGPKRAGDNA